LTTGAVIHLTTSGVDPTESDPIIASGARMTVITGLTNKLRAFRPDLSPSGVAAAIFTNKVATPFLNPPPGAVTNGTLVAIGTITPGATIYFTTNGTTPTTGSPIYAGPLTFQGSLTVEAVGVESGYNSSAIVSGSYSLAKAATPTFNPPIGPITNGTSIALACSTPGSTIYYTLDGSTPTSNSFVYASPFPINSGTTVTAFAAASGYANSGAASVLYGFKSVESTVVSTVATGLSSPRSVCVDSSGDLYVANTGVNSVRRISTLGQATDVLYASGPTGICIDSVGNLYVGDANNQVWEIQTNGTNKILVALGGIAGELGQLEVDQGGNVYVGYFGSVQKITTNGTATLLGGPECSGCPGWEIYVGVGIDTATNVYATTENNIWQIAPDGTTVLYAGGNSGYVDGPVSSAAFQHAQDAAVDTSTNIFVSDVTAVRKISANRYVSTMAGSGLAGYLNGRGAVAEFNGLAGLCVDSNGNIYVADSGNNCIRVISPDTYGIGIADWWQLAHFGYIGIDPNADPDHDGMSNYQEFWAGTDPNNPNSVFKIVSATVTNGSPQVSWSSVLGKSYNVQFSSDLITWSTIATSVPGNGSVVSFIDPSSPLQGVTRFYRVSIANL
jgi:sugar lactone lactonase YvrE